MKKILFVLFLMPFLAQAQPDYAKYDAFLQKYVSTIGKVNYKKIKANPKELEGLVKQFQAATPQTTWSKNAQLAYWINAYNLFTIKLIADNYPITSITKLDNGKPWDVKRITLGKATYSLNQIENEIIRPTFKDARIHFAVNCAAKSCPPLYNKAYTETNVQKTLEQRTSSFINSSYNVIKENEVKISKIFEWYKTDFTKNDNLLPYVSTFAKVKMSKNAKVTFLEYDWSLNE